MQLTSALCQVRHSHILLCCSCTSIVRTYFDAKVTTVCLSSGALSSTSSRKRGSNDLAGACKHGRYQH